MQKEEWQSELRIIQDIYNKIYHEDGNYSKGKNAKIRKAAGDNLEFYASKIKYQLSKNPELYDLFMGHSKDGNIGEAEKLSDLNKPWDLLNGVGELIYKIKDKIDSFG